MRIRADFEARAVVRPADVDWVPSPMVGVERRMLDRIGDEVARATSIVRYAKGSRFPAHEHGGGEEFLVLSGVFSDETADYRQGSYVRNPIGSSHTPRSDPGCEILVKLHQFDAGDVDHKVIDTSAVSYAEAPYSGRWWLPLHEYGDEAVRLEKWDAGAPAVREVFGGGQEVLVLAGRFEDESGAYETGTWIRNPRGWSATTSTTVSCLLYVKTGHLPAARLTR